MHVVKKFGLAGIIFSLLSCGLPEDKTPPEDYQPPVYQPTDNEPKKNYPSYFEVTVHVFREGFYDIDGTWREDVPIEGVKTELYLPVKSYEEFGCPHPDAFGTAVEYGQWKINKQGKTNVGGEVVFNVYTNSKKQTCFNVCAYHPEDNNRYCKTQTTLENTTLYSEYFYFHLES